jgi:hypothetical protein
MQRSICCAGIVLLATLQAIQPARGEDFVLREQLGHTWSNELVTFPVTPQQLAALHAGAVLVGPGGRTVPSQLMVADGSETRVAFQVTLDPGETLTYRVGRGAKPEPADIVVEESAAAIVLQNRHTGIKLSKSLTRDAGPIAGIRLRSGRWTSGSTLTGTAAVRKYEARVVASGPVFVDAECVTEFVDGGNWTIRVRMLNNEPVVLVSESFDMPSGGRMNLPLSGEQFQPDRMLYRRGQGRLGKVESQSVGAGRAFLLEPWLRWWMNERQGNWFAVHDAVDAKPFGELLMVAALKPSKWVDPNWSGRAKALPPQAEAIAGPSGVSMQWPLGGGQRRWMLGTPARDESLAGLDDPAKAKRPFAPRPQEYVIKHGDFPLEDVKDFVLDWPGDHANYPRLFIGAADLPGIRRQLAANSRVAATRAAEAVVDEGQAKPRKKKVSGPKVWSPKQPIDKYRLEEPLAVWFESQSTEVGDALARTSQEWLEQLVNDGLLLQNSRQTIGIAPHTQSVLLLPALNLTDAALSHPGMSEQLRKRILARVAFLGYVVHSADYWSPERGFAANPNMTTTVALYQVAIASLIPSHPQAKTWADRGLMELSRQLESWSDDDGGWLEAPHYALVSLDHILGAHTMAARAGFLPPQPDPRLQRSIEWLAKISTPPDLRTGGFRHLPPIGNTYHGEGSGIFGLAARLWSTDAPPLARRLQWMHEAQGGPPIGLFGPFATFAGYRSLLMLKPVPATAPDYGSAWFRDTGVVLRHGFGTERESNALLIAGANHEHYDFDSGSLTFWARGRALADDFGYIGRQAAEYHSLLSSPAIPADGVMQVEAFSANPAFDFVRGRKGAWQRQLALLKDPDPSGPLSLLSRDHHDDERDATWRLWLTANRVVLHEQGATVEGEQDVDLDIFVFNPAGLDLRTESTTQKSQGRRDGREGPVEISQTALVATLRGRGAISAVLVPRWKSETSPTVTWFADGAGAVIERPDGREYLFASDAERSGIAAAARPVVSPDGQVTFETNAAGVQRRSAASSATVATPGQVRVGDEVTRKFAN